MWVEFYRLYKKILKKQLVSIADQIIERCLNLKNIVRMIIKAKKFLVYL